MTRPDSEGGMRVGEIAAATGVTVRTLHHYETLGLVVPRGRSAAGHRLYDKTAIRQLYRVSMLRSLGMSLAQVRFAVDLDPSRLHDMFSEHLALATERIDQQQRLRTQLSTLVEQIASRDVTSREILQLLEEIVTLTPALERRISILVYNDLEAAYHYLVRVFGFGAGDFTRDDQGVAQLAVVQAGDGEVWLHAESEPFSLASPQTLGAATATMAILVDDVDQHFRNAVEHGAEIRYEPVDQQYGFREYGAIDLEGHLWSFMRPLE